jgi:hypothetical protein
MAVVTQEPAPMEARSATIGTPWRSQIRMVRWVRAAVRSWVTGRDERYRMEPSSAVAEVLEGSRRPIPSAHCCDQARRASTRSSPAAHCSIRQDRTTRCLTDGSAARRHRPRRGPRRDRRGRGPGERTRSTPRLCGGRPRREKSCLPESEPIRSYSELRGHALPYADPTGVQVTVHPLLRGPNPGGGSIMIRLPLPLQWLENGWTLVSPPNGDWPGEPVIAADRYLCGLRRAGSAE